MPPPIISIGNYAELNVGKESEGSVNDDPTSSTVHTQMFLTALHNVIIPLVQVAVPNQKDLHQIPLGPEAGEFLIALQKYIVSIVRHCTEPDIEAGIKHTVDFEARPLTATNKAQKRDQKGIIVGFASRENPSHPIRIGLETSAILRGLDHDNQSDRQNLLAIVLPVLRAHVFNTMPIRLLCFKKRGSDVDITLLDRTEIYSHIEANLRDRVFNTILSGVSLDKTTNIASEWISELTKYTILSHTWLRSTPGEVTYSDWNEGTFDVTQLGYHKLANFCRVAAEEHRLTFGWMDTICINKESSTELDESIRSMYKWYQNAKNCIIYLAETTTPADMDKDPWFTRGWTLQELLAPKYVTFYGADWTTLGNGLFDDKKDVNIQTRIELATSITPMELVSPLSDTSISRKMQWAASRKVTREEDAAYSLMGIFNISISIAYGEGADLAFIRLVKEILNTTRYNVLDLFNWAGRYDTDASILIPSSPAAYLQRHKFDFGRATLIEPLTLTHMGLRIPVVLMPAIPTRPRTPYTPIGDYCSTVFIGPMMDEHAVLGHFLNILVDTSPFASSSFSREGTPLGLAMAVLNCGDFDESNVVLVQHCFAIAILYSHNNGIVTPTGYKRRVPTKDPILFQLTNWRKSQNDWEYDLVPRDKLMRHGMQFLTMYL